MTSGKKKSYSVHTTELRKTLNCRTILFHANYVINTSGFDALCWQTIYFCLVIFLPVINADINVLMNLPTCLSTSPPEDDIPHAHIYVLPLAVYWRSHLLRVLKTDCWEHPNNKREAGSVFVAVMRLKFPSR